MLFYDDLVKDKKVSMNFFYTKCDEICPLVMANLAKVQRLLASHVDRSFQMYSFTLKPDEDTVEDIRDHRKRIGREARLDFSHRQTAGFGDDFARPSDSNIRIPPSTRTRHSTSATSDMATNR